MPRTVCEVPQDGYLLHGRVLCGAPPTPHSLEAAAQTSLCIVAIVVMMFIVMAWSILIVHTV